LAVYDSKCVSFHGQLTPFLENRTDWKCSFWTRASHLWTCTLKAALFFVILFPHFILHQAKAWGGRWIIVTITSWDVRIYTRRIRWFWADWLIAFAMNIFKTFWAAFKAERLSF
jgi:hypothetical protein